MAIFLGPAFPASRLQHISDLHSKFALGPHHMVSNLRPLRLGEEQKKEEENRKKKETTGQKYNGVLYYIGRP